MGRLINSKIGRYNCHNSGGANLNLQEIGMRNSFNPAAVITFLGEKA
jgi:hypothetical protein